MVLEPIIGFLICGALLLLTPVYLRYFHAEAERVPEFEQWIAAQPLVLAIACPEGRAVDVLYALRSRLKQGEFRNPSGGYPWQHYVVTLEARQLGHDVVGLFATAARPLKESDRAPVFAPWLDELAQAFADRVEGAWMHGRMKSPGLGVVADRARMGWSVRFGEAGAAAEPMIGQPTWLGRRAA